MAEPESELRNAIEVELARRCYSKTTCSREGACASCKKSTDTILTLCREAAKEAIIELDLPFGTDDEAIEALDRKLGGRMRFDQQGSSKCDVCGLDTPHAHDEQIVEIERYVRPAFEKTTVPGGPSMFGRIKAIDYPYVRGVEELWQHFISGWFASKPYTQAVARAAAESALLAQSPCGKPGHKMADWVEGDCGHPYQPVGFIPGSEFPRCKREKGHTGRHDIGYCSRCAELAQAEAEKQQAVAAALEQVQSRIFTKSREGYEDWKAKPHNAKWFKRIDGTPIPNDLVVCIAERLLNEVRALIPEAQAAPAIRISGTPYGDEFNGLYLSEEAVASRVSEQSTKLARLERMVEYLLDHSYNLDKDWREHIKWERT